MEGKSQMRVERLKKAVRGFVPGKVPLGALSNPFSFDQHGSLSIDGEKVRRVVTPELFEIFLDLESSGVLDKLHEAGLVHTQAVPEEGDRVLAHRHVPFATFPQEWTVEMLRDAAVCTLDVAIELAEAGYRLHDAHPWNVTFHHGTPLFLDFSSIRPGSDVTKGWVREFYTTFYVPVWLRNKNLFAFSNMVAREDAPIGGRIGARATGRYLFHPKALGRLSLKYWALTRRLKRSNEPAAVLRKLRQHVASMKLPRPKTEWGLYEDPGGQYDDVASYNVKATAVRLFLEKVAPGRLVDVACNRGWFCGLAATLGHESFGFDYDENAINAGRSVGLPTTYGFDLACMDIRWPTPNQGLFAQLPSSLERWQCDTLLMAAVTHHLVLRERLSFDAVAAMADAFGPKNLIVEWIPAGDQHVRRWPTHKGVEIPSWYREEEFVAAMSRYFPKHERTWSGPPEVEEQSRRAMFLFQR